MQITYELFKKSKVNPFKRVARVIKDNKTLYFMLTPYFLLFTLFTIIPVIMSIALSFTNYDVLQRPSLVCF